MRRGAQLWVSTLALEATWCAHTTAGDGVHTASPLQPWLRQHCHGHCGAPDKYVSIMPVMLSARKCPCLEMLRRG